MIKINIGWVKRWKKLHSITRKRMIGEAGDVTDEMTNEWYSIFLPNILERFHENDIFNIQGGPYVLSQALFGIKFLILKQY